MVIGVQHLRLPSSPLLRPVFPVQGKDSGRFWQKAMAAGSVPHVGGRVLDLSRTAAQLVLAHLRRGEGYERLAAALASDLGSCGGLAAAPFATLWLRPGSLDPLLIVSSEHGCSDQVGWGNVVRLAWGSVRAALAAVCMLIHSYADALPWLQPNLWC